MSLSVVALALLLLPTEAGVAARVTSSSAEEPTLELRQQVSVLTGYDSNAKRVPYAVSSELAADATETGTLLPAVVGDAYLQASGGLSATTRVRGVFLRLDGALGAKLFSDLQRPARSDDASHLPLREATRTDRERMLVAEAGALLAGTLPYDIDVRLETQGKLRAQASGARTYGYERTDLLLSRELPAGLVLHGGIAGQVFHSLDLPTFSSFGGGASAGLSWRPSARERFTLSLGALQLAYPFARAQPEDDVIRRLDLPLHGSLVFTSARRVFVSLGYVVVRNNSNAFAESYTRHRLFGILGFRLPADVTVSTRGAVQVTQYDEGLSLSRQYFLQEDDESQNSLSLLVTRPFLGGLHLEGQLAWYGNELARGGVKFSRTTATVGVRAEL